MSEAAIIYSTERHLTRRGVLWVGLRCDVRCKFCYDERLGGGDKIWLTVAEAVGALNKFRYYYQNTAVDLMGGEPTLHPHILEIVGHAAQIGLRPTVITHGMHLADLDRVTRYAEAGIHDFLVSIHGIGDTVAEIHGRGTDNFAKQVRALDNLRTLGIPFRFNCTLVRDNLQELEAIAELAVEKGACVVNFLTFNPYFEWSADEEIKFQARHSEVAPRLARAIDHLVQAGVEANVRYMPLCQMRGYEPHMYTGFQLPYDAHEWDYNSWYDCGHVGRQGAEWYREASARQRDRHHYAYAPGCQDCAAKGICDGFHAQYLARFGDDEAMPYSGPAIVDPCHFVGRQQKIEEPGMSEPGEADVITSHATSLATTQFNSAADHRAGIRFRLPDTQRR